MTSYIKFDQFVNGGILQEGDIIVGLRNNTNYQFNAIPNVVQTWNGSPAAVNVTAGRNINIDEGVISTNADVNIVTAWNGSTTPVAITAGNNIDITGGVISGPAIVPQVVNSWDGTTTPVDVVAGSGITITDGIIATTAGPQVVSSWDGLTTPVDVTEGRNIDIASGVISTTADPNVVTSWNGFVAEVAVTAGDGIDITDGVISNIAPPGVVASWNGSTTPVDVTAGTGISITSGVINAVVSSWNSLTTPVAVTAGTGISITSGVITNTSPTVVTSWNGSSTPVAVTAGSGISITSGVITATGIGQGYSIFSVANGTVSQTFSSTALAALTVGGTPPSGRNVGNFTGFLGGSVQYTGSPSVWVDIQVCFTFTSTGSRDYIFYIYQYPLAGPSFGAVVGNYQQQVTSIAGNTFVGVLGKALMVTGNTVQLYASSPSGAGSFTVLDYTIYVKWSDDN